jgi:perosamine synthetase
MIPYGKHFLDEDDIDSVVDVLRNGWLTQGPKIRAFEEAISDRVNAKYAVAVSSATAALHLCCIAKNIGEGDVLITSANTFVASSNCAIYEGATPEFCDIDPESLNMCTDSLRTKVSLLPSVSAIVPVHFSGVPCDMVTIGQIAKECNAFIIEDASHALGSEYPDGTPVGNCKHSDMTVFSLHPVKGVTAGEGGVITTNDELLYKRLMQLRSHGICKGNFDMPGVGIADSDLINVDEALEDGDLNPWYYEMQELGYNYRITDIQAALALSQLGKLDRFIARRKEIAGIYDQLFSTSDNVRIRQSATRVQSSHHLYVIEIDYESLSISRKKVMEQLREKGYGTQVHYIPVPMQPYYQALGHSLAKYPNTESYYRRGLSIPIYFGLENDSAHGFVETLLSLLDGR